MGIRYLNEGNYEEAILASTAAIKIDSKIAHTYVGRGGTHSRVASLATDDVTEKAELSPTAISSYENAIMDYLSAIDLDPVAPEVYIKVAEVYMALGDIDSTINVLERGYRGYRQ